MSAGTPWSVKGIDAKAREVAKDLARRSGMTLGEWLNQMILEGRDVSALIHDERSRSGRDETMRHRAPETRIAPESRFPYDDDDDAYELDAPVARRQAPGGAPLWADRPRAPYSTGAQPLASRDLRRRSIFEDQPRPSREADRGQTDDLNRVARALETLGSRIETSETRSAGAVRSVSAAVESLLSRLERSESEHAETREALQDQSLQTDARLSRAEADSGQVSDRLVQAERLIDAQAERLEGLSGHLREERERVARLEAQLRDGPVAETVRSVEGAIGKLANQVYEGEARTRDSLKDVREDLLGLSHRLAQMEMRDPDRAAQTLIDKVVAQLAQRLEAAEAQTSGAIRNLEQAFNLLEGRMNRAEERGDVTDPEAVRSLTGLAADLSRQVAESRSEWRQALDDNRQQTLTEALGRLDERIEASEKRSASAIEKMGQDVLRIAGNLNRRMTGVETASQDGLNRMGREIQRVADSIDSRISHSENSHAQALERLGGEIARISERLNARLADSERRTTEVLTSIGEQVAHQRDHVREDLAERIRQSEARTARLLEDTRARIDEKLARVQTESLLSEAVARASKPVDDRHLPDPFTESDDEQEKSGFGTRPVFEAPVFEAPVFEAPVFEAPAFETPAPEEPDSGAHAPHTKKGAPEADAADEGPIDLTGHLLGGITDVAPEFDPFAPDGLEDDLEPAAAAPHGGDDDDSDPFADIDISRKTAPRSRSLPDSSAGTVLNADLGDGLDDAFEPEPSISLTTRDALAAARAAVRASLENQDERGLLGSLKPGISRRNAPPKDAKGKDAKGKDKGGNTLLNAFKASSLAGALVVVGTTGYLAFKNATPDAPAKGTAGPIAAAAVDVTSADDARDQQALKTRYDLALKSLDARAPGAVNALKQVANQGYAPAQYRLSLLYSGKDHLLPADKTEARLWTQRAAEGGIAPAMYNFGTMYYNGDGGAQDHSIAAMWFRKAAERGVKDGQYNLGVLYERGDGVPLNPSEAYKWLRIAGNSGDKMAAQEADDLAEQLTDEQRQRAEDAVSRFTPITDGAPPMPGSES